MAETQDWAHRHGLRQSDVAMIGGVTTRAASDWCRGVTPPPQSFRLLMQAVDDGLVPLAWLAGAIGRLGSDPAEPPAG